MKKSVKDILIKAFKIFGWVYLIVFYLNDMFFPDKYLMLTPLGGKGYWGIVVILILLVWDKVAIESKNLTLKKRIIHILILLAFAVPYFIVLYLRYKK